MPEKYVVFRMSPTKFYAARLLDARGENPVYELLTEASSREECDIHIEQMQVRNFDVMKKSA